MESATLEFPEIAAPAEPRTEVATAAASALDLEKLNLTDLALAKFGDWRGAVAAVTANLGSLALDLSTQARVDEAKSLRERLINKPRAEARKVSKALRSKFATTGKEVAAAEEQVVEAWDKAETLITPKIDAAQKTLDDQKAQRAAEEEARKEKHRSGIANIRCYLDRCNAPGMTAARIANGMEVLKAQTYGPDWEEFQVPAANAQCETLEAMRQLHAQVLGREQEAARQEAIRLENEARARELAEAQARIDAETEDLRRRAAAIEEAEKRQRAASSIHFVQLGDPQALPETTFTTTPVTAAGFASLGERFTDEDPAAATKIPTGEVHESTDPQDGVGLMEVAPAAEQATISLTALKEWLHMPSGLTREFVEALGVIPTIDGRSFLFTATQRREFKAALIKFIEGLPA